jgi:hypothetical protein
LVEQSKRKWRFQLTSATTTSSQSISGGDQMLQKNTMSVQPYGKAVSSAQKVNFYISRHCMCEYTSQRPEVITTDYIDIFMTNNFWPPYAAIKTHGLKNEKIVPNGLCAINAKKIDIKQAMKFIGHYHQDFWTAGLAWETTSKGTRTNKILS